MKVNVNVSQSDIDSIAQKLDQFATVLTPQEQNILLAVLELAGESIQKIVHQAESAPHPSVPPADPKLPSLSTGFRDAFKDGAGTSFNFDTADTEDGEVHVGGQWSKAIKPS